MAPVELVDGKAIDAVVEELKMNGTLPDSVGAVLGRVNANSKGQLRSPMSDPKAKKA